MVWRELNAKEWKWSMTTRQWMHFDQQTTLFPPLLLQFFIGLTTIAIDSTYKLKWNGYLQIVFSKKNSPVSLRVYNDETKCDFYVVSETMRNAIEAILWNISACYFNCRWCRCHTKCILTKFWSSVDIMCFAQVPRKFKILELTTINGRKQLNASHCFIFRNEFVVNIIKIRQWDAFSRVWVLNAKSGSTRGTALRLKPFIK